MNKVFEDYFSELQADMVSICLEDVEDRAEKIYIYASCEGSRIECYYFFKVNGKIVHKEQLNNVILESEETYDVSPERKDMVLSILNEDMQKIKELCIRYKQDIPTEIRLVYDVEKNSLKGQYCYELIYTKENLKTRYDTINEWMNELKQMEEK